MDHLFVAITHALEMLFFFKEKKTTPCVTCTQSCCYVFIAQHHYRKSLTVFILLSMP